MLILMAGLPGTGKSALAVELSRQIGGHVLNKDSVRDALFATQFVEYSTAQDDFVIGLMLQAAEYLLRRIPSLHVFIDGRPFSRTSQLEDAIAFADRIGTPWRILECVCPDEVARERLERDALQRAHPAVNRSYQLYLGMKARFEPITRPKTVIDTRKPLDLCVERALHGIGIQAA